MTTTFSLAYTFKPAMVQVCIGRGILADLLAAHCKKIGYRVALLADTTVAALHAQPILDILLRQGISTELFTFPAGEKSKNRETKAQLEDQLFAKKYARDTLLIALGGGVTMDLAGFIASSFCRGVALLLLPSTLLAMVDASLGGKTSLNVPAGKNLLGSFYHPLGIYMELDFLETLPTKELHHGLIEMIKHGLVLEGSYFAAIEKQAAVCSLEMRELVLGSCRLKQEVVQEDPFEQGKRRLLNFGHTIGHALEAASQYTFSHGDAVAIGMVAEAELAIEKGYMQDNALQRLKKLYAILGIDPKISFNTTPEELYAYMQADKKTLNQIPRFVMLKQVGQAESFAGTYCAPVEMEILFRVLKKVCTCYAQ